MVLLVGLLTAEISIIVISTLKQKIFESGLGFSAACFAGIPRTNVGEFVIKAYTAGPR